VNLQEKLQKDEGDSRVKSHKMGKIVFFGAFWGKITFFRFHA